MSFPTDALSNIGNRQTSTPAGILSQSMSPTIDANGVIRYKNVDRLDTSTSFGLGAVAQYDGSAAFGAYAVAVDRAAIAIGPYSKAQGISAIAIGEQTVANRAMGIAIGPRCLTNTPYSIVIGMLAKCTVGLNGLGGQVVIGYKASSAGDNAIAIGELAQADGDFSIAIGSQAKTNNTGAVGTYPIAIGNFALSNGEGIAIGSATSAGSTYNIAIGSGAASGKINSIAMGRASVTTEDGQMLIGCAAFPINLAVSGKIKLYNNLTPTDGQILIGKTATNTFEAATVTGTAHQVIVTNGAGSIVLSAPQDLDTTSSPVFANMKSGTYTPTYTSVTNITSVTAFVTGYTIVGSVVTVFGRVLVTATATGQAQLGISLPVASAFANASEAGGTGFDCNVAGVGFAVVADVANARCEFQWVVVAAGLLSQDYHFSFSYRII